MLICYTIDITNTAGTLTVDVDDMMIKKDGTITDVLLAATEPNRISNYNNFNSCIIIYLLAIKNKDKSKFVIMYMISVIHHYSEMQRSHTRFPQVSSGHSLFQSSVV